MVPQPVHETTKISDSRAVQLVEEVFDKAGMPCPLISINRMDPDLNASSNPLLNSVGFTGGALEVNEDLFKILVAHEAGHLFHKHVGSEGPIPVDILRTMGFKIKTSDTEAEIEADDFAANLIGREPLIRLLEQSLKDIEEKLANKEHLRSIDRMNEFFCVLTGCDWTAAEEQLLLGKAELTARLEHQRKK